MRHWPQSFKCWDCRQVLPHIAEVVVVMCVCVWYKCGAYMPLHAYRCQRIVWGVSSHFVPCWGRVYISDYFCCCAAYSRLVGTWTSWWFFCLCLPSCGRDAGLQICTITISFYMGLNSGHQAYYIAIFLTCWAMSPALFVYSWNKVSYSLVWLEPAPAFKLLYCSRLVPFCLAKLNFHYFLSALWKKSIQQFIHLHLLGVLIVLGVKSKALGMWDQTLYHWTIIYNPVDFYFETESH